MLHLCVACLFLCVAYWVNVSLQLVELKNGETYNGHLVNCDNWMNIQLREVICTSRVGLPVSGVYDCFTSLAITCVWTVQFRKEKLHSVAQHELYKMVYSTYIFFLSSKLTFSQVYRLQFFSDFGSETMFELSMPYERARSKLLNATFLFEIRPP